jgi:DNA-binding PadR family transcriptional regulator
MELSTSAYVILGFLRLGPIDEPRHGARSGYDIKRSVDLTARVFWNISPAQIYPELKKLEEEGLVRGREEPHGKRARRVFELTSEGEAALQEWLARDETAALEIRDEAMLKLLFADAVEPEVAIKLLRSMRERSEQALSAIVGGYPAGLISEAKGDKFPIRTGLIGAAIHQAIVDTTRQLEAEVMAETAPAKAK